MELAELLSTYSEVGILGLIAIVFIYLAVDKYKSNSKTLEKKDELENKGTENIQNQQAQMLSDLQKQQAELVSQLQAQNNLFMQHQTEYMEKLIAGVSENINNHVPSHEETEKISKANLEIDKVLKHILDTLDADRVGLIQYHNGGKNLNKTSFLKMSMTNEQIKLGKRSMMAGYKDQFRGMIARWVETADEDGIVKMDNIEEVKHHDAVMYEFFKLSGIESAYGARIENDEGYSIGFLAIHYEHKTDVSCEKIHKELVNQQSTIQALLNIKI